MGERNQARLEQEQWTSWSSVYQKPKNLQAPNEMILFSVNHVMADR
jgi:hypothetical protein